MIVKNIKITPYDTAWNVACKLINAEIKGENFIGQEVTSPFFTIEDLRKIGEHLVNYCNTEKESDTT